MYNMLKECTRTYKSSYSLYFHWLFHCQKGLKFSNVSKINHSIEGHLQVCHIFLLQTTDTFKNIQIKMKACHALCDILGPTQKSLGFFFFSAFKKVSGPKAWIQTLPQPLHAYVFFLTFNRKDFFKKSFTFIQLLMPLL